MEKKKMAKKSTDAKERDLNRTYACEYLVEKGYKDEVDEIENSEDTVKVKRCKIVKLLEAKGLLVRQWHFGKDYISEKAYNRYTKRYSALQDYLAKNSSSE